MLEVVFVPFPRRGSRQEEALFSPGFEVEQICGSWESGSDSWNWTALMRDASIFEAGVCCCSFEGL